MRWWWDICWHLRWTKRNAMGTDIDLYVERRVDGKWVTADEWVQRGTYKSCKHIYSDRNYDLFGVLAGVRGDDDYFIPIELPRGLPEDVCPEVLEDYRVLCGHSCSWYTLKELL